MTTPLHAMHPFGTDITLTNLRERFTPLRQWEDKYRQLILLGKQLPTLSEQERGLAQEIPGCENRVWLGCQTREDGRLHFFGDSEGRIVRGLLAILLTAIEGQTSEQIRDNDPLALFDELHLREQLSASRAQGLAALALAVHQQAARSH